MEKWKKGTLFGISLLILIFMIGSMGENAQQNNQTQLPMTTSPELVSPSPTKSFNWVLRSIDKLIFKIKFSFYRIFFWFKKKRLLKGIHEGMTETQVNSILGNSKYKNEWIAGQPLFGPQPNLPQGTKYRTWYYPVNDTIFQGFSIYLISPEDYSTITGKVKEGKDWIVIQIYMDTGVIY